MMGAHHAACGAAAWVALTTSATVNISAVTEPMGFGEQALQLGFGLMDLSPVGVLVGAFVCAGAALLPDADHHNATIAHSLPPLSNIMCASVGKLAGGHRHGTHSIIGIIAFVALAWVAGLLTFETELFGTIYPGAGIMSVLLVAFAVKALKIIPDGVKKSPWIVGLLAGTFIALFAPEEQFWFPAAMGIGVIVHILGDMMTTGGCNLVWPFTIRPPKVISRTPVLNRIWMKNGYVSFPVLGNAGSWREWLLLVPISAYAIFGAVYALSQMGKNAVGTVATMFIQ